ncbi:MAG: SOS response-associated peptidase [Syntrophales bacterium]|nr:SOS response-associated peptidase [Syntrophales bacterium]
MCGRFTLLADLSIIVDAFDIREVVCEYGPSHNICPGQQVIAVTHDKINRLVDFKWGLVPSWAKEPSIGNKMINARAETLAEKPGFKTAFKKQRCLIVADGFYEWKTDGKRKIPVLFSLKSGEPFVFAGLYDNWMPRDGRSIKTCTIITTSPNELVAPIHDRMPVILPKDAAADWIDPENTDAKKLSSLLKPYPASEMEMREIEGKI